MTYSLIVHPLTARSTLSPYTTLFRSQIIEPANALPAPVKPLVALTLVLALIAGGALGVGCALVFDLLRSEEHTSELQSLRQLVCRLLLEKKQPQLIRRLANHRAAEARQV